MVTDVLPGGSGLRRVLGVTGPDGEIPDVPPEPVTIDRVRSAARGTDVDLVVMGAAPGRPICLALHGRGGDARSFADMGVARFLTALRRDGVPPFGVVAVDGGSTYYVDDALRMLRDELPAWLGERGLPVPTAAVGISMGAFGALRYAREVDLRAVAVIGPALFRDWADAKLRDVFRDEGHWLANEPLRHTGDLEGTALGVWCGTEDPFVDAAREFVDAARPEVAAIGAGAHDGGYFLRVLPDALRFVGNRLSGA
jgi:S-formylglutathione hydrolase FrmB